MAPREGAQRSGRRRQADGAGESSKRHQHRRKRPAAGRPGATSKAEERREEKRHRRASSSQNLSAGALAQLDREHDRRKRKTDKDRRKHQRGEYQEVGTTPRSTPQKPRKPHKSKKRRVVSGAVMEEGRAGRSGLRGGGSWGEDEFDKEELYRRRRREKPKKKLWVILGAVSVVLIIIIVVVAVVVSKKNDGDGSSKSSSLDGKDPNQVPSEWKNTYLDPWSWKTTTGFNVTFTDQMIGGLPVMGLFSDWDDSAKANDKVPALNEDWGPYGSRPARGVNLGGWLSLEPFITPSLFNYNSQMGIVDEYTLCQHLGASAASTLENHYASFVTEDTFKAIAAAGLDHVRIPFSYWAVEIYDGDPYVFRTSWRYLLRAIEWARKYGLRVNLDLHGLPGSQNGWNHSGRLGAIGWLNGTNGHQNGQRSLDVHDKLTQFFAQDRYKKILTHYGLANEPRMTFLKTADVVKWTEDAYKIVRKNGVKALVIFGDGFMGLDNWKGLMTGYDDMVLDVHQYVIFNEGQIAYTHQKKVQYACDGWTQQAQQSMNTQTGYGPTLFAEWSQADTDCTRHLTNVGWGNRWEGTLNTGDSKTSVLTPRCPTKDSSCSCAQANADPSKYSDQYKKFLQMFAEAQMHSFEKGWGWWYWTWKTESAPLWSYEAALKAGIMPTKAYSREFNCDTDVPDFAKGGLAENY
ncbi:exo-beta-1,3-glucanase [Metarhizium rileyi]|uniref:glucan 1,3-beta-glucosidase n=1 Tax=Metarhizium rileyi (strain RCEF 4871) TaxID=1649241 RepID=A0A162K0Y6_METRR|nr:exo-beta-1,3-glucanase [Metarhizium rileyi RCEF 4871]